MLTHHSKVLTTPSSHIGKIKVIYRNANLVNTFYIPYTKSEYDIVSLSNVEILSVDSNHKINFHEHCNIIV